VGLFFRGRPSSALTPVHLHVRAGLLAHYRTAIADRRGLPVSSLFPQISHVSCPRVLTSQIPGDGPATHHHPTPQGGPCVRLPPWVVASTVVCHGVPSPLLCYRPSLLQTGCCARSLMMKPRVACPTGWADMAKSVSSRPWCSPAGMCV
jgi:hypothetical protein